MDGEQTKTVRRGQPRVGNGSGGRLDAEERAHGGLGHGATGEGREIVLIGGR